MFDQLTNLFKKKESSAIGIDIGSSSIKVVQLKKSGNRAVLETYGELALGPYAGVSVGQSTKLSTDKITEAVRDLLNEKEVNLSTKNAGVAIPFHAALMSVIELPAVQEAELDTMVPIEARKYIPVPMSEVTLNWSVIPKFEVHEQAREVSDEIKGSKSGKSIETLDILLAAIHNNIIAEYQSVTKETGLSVSFFEIELFSVVRSILDEEIHSAMIIDIGASSTKLYILERGIVRGSHILNKGSQSITQAIASANNMSFQDAEVLKRTVGMGEGEKGSLVRQAAELTCDYIFSEAGRTLYDYNRRYNRNVDKVILIGGGSALKGIDELASKSFQVPVEAGNPFMKVDTPAFLVDVLRETGPEFAVSVGVALRKLKEI